MKRAEIVNNTVHWIFDADEYPREFPPYPDGAPVLLIDLEGDNECAETGDKVNPVTGKVVKKPDYTAYGWGENGFVWNDKTYEWDVIEPEELLDLSGEVL